MDSMFFYESYFQDTVGKNKWNIKKQIFNNFYLMYLLLQSSII